MGAFEVISVPSPKESDIVNNVRECARRRLSHSVQKEDPKTPELLKKIFVEGNLMNQRIILSYAGFLCVSELLNLKFCDMNIVDTHMSIFIEKSTTDIYRDGNWLVISRTCTKLCPVLNLEHYIKYDNFDDHYYYLLRNITKFS